MKLQLETLLRSALKQLKEANEIVDIPPIMQIEMTKDKIHGDFACNIALILAKSAQMAPRMLAEKIVRAIPASPYVAKIEIAGPGFINFFLSAEAITAILPRILKEKENFGKSKAGQNKRVLVEFVSSNPTGPLHVGHGRHAVVGDVIANLLNAVGFQAHKEYYVNDAGRQMDILTVSIWMRYLNECGQKVPFPANGYQGDYVTRIAHAIAVQHVNHFVVPAGKVLEQLPLDEAEGGDKEIYIDAIINRCKTLLGEKYTPLFDLGLQNILTDIREDLAEFGVHYDRWFSEKELYNCELIDKLLLRLRESGIAYEKDGALWFAASRFGDDKDRVLVRSNGALTYFTPDVAYHLNKFDREFDIAIDILGSDHHGYVPRMKAAMSALNINPERLTCMLLQFVYLYREGKQVQMSTRGGNFITLRELRKEVGHDAARFFYLLRKCEQHIDFDLDLAKSKSNENPVYYVQYAYARICSVFKQLKDKNLTINNENGLLHLHLLTAEQERQLLNGLSRYPDIILNAAITYEPSLLINYLRELAGDFHTYYNSHHFLVEDANLRDARLILIAAIAQTLLNGFHLIGISAMETM